MGAEGLEAALKVGDGDAAGAGVEGEGGGDDDGLAGDETAGMTRIEPWRQRSELTQRPATSTLPRPRGVRMR